MKNKILLYTLILLFVTFLSVFTYNYDYDLFARLEVGEIFFKLHTILKHDPFSYTPTLMWYDHEWGSGVIFYAFLKLFGTAGFIILNSILFTLAAIFILKKNNNITYPLITSTFFLMLMYKSGGLIIRCQAFTFCFMAVLFYILEKYRHQNTKWVFIFPVIIALWCNLHGGVTAGLGLMCLYLVFLLIQKKNVIPLFFAIVLSFFALFVNPYGTKYPMYLFYTITVPRDHIADWCSIFHPEFFMTYIPIIIVFFIILSIKIFINIKNRKFDIIEYVLLILFTIMSFSHIKTLELAYITLFMFCSQELNEFLTKIKISYAIERSLYAVIPVIALFIPLTITTPRVTFDSFPLKEVEFIRINNIKGNLFVPFEYGSYATYKLYPKNLIYMDGRYDGVYPYKTFVQLYNFCTKREGWKEVFEEYPTEIIMVEITDPVYQDLLHDENLGWKEIYKGYQCGVFVKKDKAESFYLKPNHDINYYRKNIFKTNFIDTLRKTKYD